MKEADRFKDLKTTLALEYSMDVNDIKFQAIYNAADSMAGNNGLRAVDHYFSVFYTLMEPYF